MSETTLSWWIATELAEADLMSGEGSYDGEDYWRGVSDTLNTTEKQANFGGN